MDSREPTMEEWSRLYQAAIAVKEMAPWTWMSETDVFGVENPETGEPGFVSIMGEMGEHLAVAVYLGVRGLYEFWRFVELGEASSMQDFTRMPHLQAEFQDRTDLRKRDRDIIKALGLKFRGRKAWPLFRSYRPGYHPWFLEGHEARFLALALEQVQNIAPRFRENPAMLPREGQEYLVRVYQDGEWQDRIKHFPAESIQIPLYMNMKALEMLHQLPIQPVCLEVDLPIVPGGIGKRGQRPAFGFVLLVVESTSGWVLGSQACTADPSLDEMYGRVPMLLVEILAQIGLRPQEIVVRSDLLYQLLGVLAEELKFSIGWSQELPALEDAKQSLFSWLRR